jgi:phenylalanyl-tRNA synthetase beta chain
VADRKAELAPPPDIELPLEWLARKLGREIGGSEVREILERLQFGVQERRNGVFAVSVPTWRATKDISIKDDLVEEVGRMVGYDSITPRAPLVPAAVPPDNPRRKFQHEVRNLFADLGFTEVYNYSFISEDHARAFGEDPAAHVRVANPIASDQQLLRASLLAGIHRNILENSKRREAFRLFEVGQAYDEAGEVTHLAAAVYERHGDAVASLFALKHAAACLMPGSEACPAHARPFEHPARAADIFWKGQRVGRLFELHPNLVEVGRAAVLDLNLEAIQPLMQAATRYTPVRRYPSSAFDLSVIAGLREHAGRLESAIRSFAGPLVETVEFLRQYSGAPLREDQKSVSYRVTVGSSERTLSSEEVAEVRSKIIEGMRSLGYDLRV